MTEEKRRHYLPKVVRGEFLNASSLSEPDTGSDVAAIRTTANQTAADGSSAAVSPAYLPTRGSAVNRSSPGFSHPPYWIHAPPYNRSIDDRRFTAADSAP